MTGPTVHMVEEIFFGRITFKIIFKIVVIDFDGNPGLMTKNQNNVIYGSSIGRKHELSYLQIMPWNPSKNRYILNWNSASNARDIR